MSNRRGPEGPLSDFEKLVERLSDSIVELILKEGLSYSKADLVIAIAKGKLEEYVLSPQIYGCCPQLNPHSPR